MLYTSIIASLLIAVCFSTSSQSNEDPYLVDPTVNTNASYRGILSCGDLAVGRTDEMNMTVLYRINLTNAGSSVTFSTCHDNHTIELNPNDGDNHFDTGISIWALNVGQVPDEQVTAECIAENDDKDIFSSEFCSELDFDTSLVSPDTCLLIQMGPTSVSRDYGLYGLSMTCTGGASIPQSCFANYTEMSTTETPMTTDMTTEMATTEMDTTEMDTTDMATTDMATTDMATTDMATTDMATTDMGTTDMATTYQSTEDLNDTMSTADPGTGPGPNPGIESTIPDDDAATMQVVSLSILLALMVAAVFV